MSDFSLKKCESEIFTLISDLETNPNPVFSSTVYETAMFSCYTHDKTLRAEQIRLLLASQSKDGSWGMPGYRVIPSVAAIMALLKYAVISTHNEEIIEGVMRGVRALEQIPEYGVHQTLPDTVASEIILPVIKSEILILAHEVLQEDTDIMCVERVFSQPLANEMSMADCEEVARSLTRSRDEQGKFAHILEVLMTVLPEVTSAVAPRDGCIACSPAATCAWAAATDSYDESVRNYLVSCVSSLDKGVSVCSQMDYFEMLWCVIPIAEAGYLASIPSSIFKRLSDGFDHNIGIGGGPGLPPDADDTAYFGLLHEFRGRPMEPSTLERFWVGDHFATYTTEQTASVTTNAHALEYLIKARCHTEKIGNLISWMYLQQETDGSWTDKWHVSPLYATAAVVKSHCVSIRCLTGNQLNKLMKGVYYLLRSQNSDGGWGIKQSNGEETGYVIFALMEVYRAEIIDKNILLEALGNAFQFLLNPGIPIESGLWMGKDLYSPRRISKSIFFTSTALLFKLFGESGDLRATTTLCQ